MCADIVDNRRTDKSADNRQKYMEHEKDKIRQGVRKRLQDVGIKDITSGKDIDIDIENDASEGAEIGYSQDKGSYDMVGTGNDEYAVGDTFPMPPGNERGREGDPDAPDEEASFNFKLTAEEFINIFFDDLCLPYQFKKMLTEEDSNQMRRAGFVSDGSPARLSVIRTYRNSIGRTLAERNDYLTQLEDTEDEDKKLELEEKIKNIPLFRDVDLRFVNWTPEPVIKFKSVMFCILDVSGSMGERERLHAKRFFLLLYVFLKRCYTSVDIVFIRHTTHAEEVDEKTFFYNDLSGGTVLSPTLELVDEIIKSRYAGQNYNIYVAQATDGDNSWGDNSKFFSLLKDVILPQIQYYCYIETPTDLWGTGAPSKYGSETYKGLRNQFIKDPKTSAVGAKIVNDASDIWKAFAELFKRRSSGVDYEKL